MKSAKSSWFFLLVQISTVAVFLGRAWQHIFWDAPFRTILWDQKLMGDWVANWLGMSWQEYVSSPVIEDRIRLSIVLVGVFYLLAAFVAAFIRRLPKASHFILPVGGFLLLILASLYWKEKFLHYGQLLEYSLQFGSPFFLWFLLRERVEEGRLIVWMKWATAVTFFSHGLYAVGYYPRPESFTSMVMACLGTSESASNSILDWAGRIDFVVAFLLVIPGRWVKPALAYCVFWGFVTALARPWANFYPEFWQESLHQWVHQFVYRFPHFLIPLAIFIWLRFQPSSKAAR